MAELTWQKAIQEVLAASTGPLHYKEITDRIWLMVLEKT